MQEQIVQDLLELVKIPVQSRNERQIADNVKAKLEALGLDVSEDPIYVESGNTGNIRALLKGDPNIEPVLFSAHLDRVKNNEKISPVFDEENNVLRADGTTILAADDVSGICVTLDALRRIMASNKPHGDIEVAFSVCEEAGVLGSKYFDFASFK
ncbi:MAG: M20/M25/M40 family metallo-hydrolase, partial [Phascolarctobacterium sp.]